MDQAHVTKLTESNVGLRSAVNMMDYYLFNLFKDWGYSCTELERHITKGVDWIHACVMIPEVCVISFVNMELGALT